MSEFASGPAISTLGGQIRNPYALDRSPAGSSGGNGAALAAGFSAFALGTDTGGSIRGPASANGIAGLRPDLWIDGSRRHHPAGVVAGYRRPDGRARRGPGCRPQRDGRARPARWRGGRAATYVDYTAALDPSALKGARLGLVRDFMGVDPAWDAVIEAAVAALRNQGAEVIDIALPRYMLGLSVALLPTIRDTEFRFQIEEYLAALPRADSAKNARGHHPAQRSRLAADIRTGPRTRRGWSSIDGKLPPGPSRISPTAAR